MSWLQAVPLMAVAASLLFLPGLGLGYALGVRGVAHAVTAPALSLAVISTAAIVTTAAGVTWSWASLSGYAVLVTALVAAVRFAVQRGTGWQLSLRITLKPGPFFTGLAISAVALAGWAVVFFPQATLFAQTFDNTFHLNAIRHILDTGRASSLTIQEVAGGSGLYPAAWHAVVALVAAPAGAMLSQTAVIPVAVNATTIAVIVGAWAAGVVALAQAMAARTWAVSLLAAAVVAATPVFPWLFIEWGSLYPNLLGVSLIPGLTAVVLMGARTDTAQNSDRAGLSGEHARWVAAIVVLVSLLGVTFAHPSATFTVLAISLVAAFGVVAARLLPVKPPLRPGLLVGAAVLVIAAVGFVWAWVHLAPPLPTAAPDAIGLRTALTRWALAAPVKGSPAMWAWPGLLTLGVVAGIKRREFTPIVLTVVGAVVFVAAATTHSAELSRAFGGLFYQDPRRIEVFALVMALPLGMSALGLVDDFLTTRLAQKSGWVRPARIAAVVVLSLAITVPTWVRSMGPHLSAMPARISVPSAKRHLNPDEMALIERLRADVPAGAAILGDPGNGSSLIYALSGVPVVFPHYFTKDSPAATQLREHLFDPDQRAASCAAVRSLHAWYFADFGAGTKFFAGPKYYPGLTSPDFSMMTLVDSVGSARLYRITGCE